MGVVIGLDLGFRDGDVAGEGAGVRFRIVDREGVGEVAGQAVDFGGGGPHARGDGAADFFEGQLLPQVGPELVGADVEVAAENLDELVEPGAVEGAFDLEHGVALDGGAHFDVGGPEFLGFGQLEQGDPLPGFVGE